MTEQAGQNGTAAPEAEREVHEPSGVAQLNLRTAKRQRMLLGGIATVLLAGASWASSVRCDLFRDAGKNAIGPGPLVG